MEYKNKSIPGVYKDISYVMYTHEINSLKLSDNGSYECEVEQEINGTSISKNKTTNINICMSVFIIIYIAPNNASD